MPKEKLPGELFCTDYTKKFHNQQYCMLNWKNYFHISNKLM